MQSYLVIRDFRRRLNKKRVPYRWPISVYSTPEALWGYDHIASAYSLEPEKSRECMRAQVKQNFPDVLDLELDVVLG